MNYDGDPSSREGRTGLWMRIAAIIFPALFVVQGLLVAFGVIDKGRYIGLVPFVISSIIFMAIAIISVLTPIEHKPMRYVRTWGFSIAGLVLTSITTGFATPLALGLILMLYDAYRLLGLRGLLVSTMLMTVAVMVDIYRGLLIGDEFPVYAAITTLGVITIMGILMSILRVQHVRQSLLEKSSLQAQLERDRITTLMNNLSQGVISTNSKGYVTTYNAAVLNLLDTNKSLMGQAIDDVLSIEDKSGAKIAIKELLGQADKGMTRDDLYYNYGDERIRVEVTITPIVGPSTHSSEPRRSGHLLMMRDITKQKDLDDERDEFISVVSHELRTPLTIAEGTLSNIETMYEKKINAPEKILPSLRAAHSQMIYLAKMVNDLSTLSRAERGIADTPENIDIRTLLQDMYREYEPQARRAGLQMNIDLGARLGSVHVSRLYLSELLQNFITNALKYTREGSVSIKATATNGTVSIMVKDTGIGISKTDQKKIFDKFYRSEDYRTRETGGTGLGLYVAQKLARKLGTTIELKSRLNHGSEFTITFPVQK
jgi:signal transduction histidine kinase